ncbi:MULTISPECIES: hypothetical protein [unclassified Mesorhizobium]|uniref:hypothetical protein n=1 Tax=unclassified Mesorhizobium TaxID=325217 RepID=UPI00112CC72A|nr:MULTISPECIES: hypothetical protein [unclassified Mesorhizobium]TPK90257.1 hypothetical protein FJ548_07790 [Mesorhizobium sp. B2-4-17]TPL10171.1 hypothetical protein FJ938_05530 [Mesorhizobium sp. B2-4-14]
MESLTIQDAFAPYYAGRNSAPLPRDKRLPAEDEASLSKRAARALPTNARLSNNKPDSTTEH